MPAHAEDEAGRVADEFIESSRCPVRETASDEAFYSPGSDEVVVPMRGQFADNKGFLNVLLHEMTHSTGPELGRDMGGLFRHASVRARGAGGGARQHVRGGRRRP